MSVIKKFGLYVHIPFCVKKCDYCDFLSFAQWDDRLVNRYTERLMSEITNLESEAVSLETIYFGGGTPSAIPSDCIEKIIRCIEKQFEVIKGAERTIEINPATGLQSSIARYRKIGFNRASVGLQSANNRLLKLLGRAHTKEDFLNTYHMLCEEGFKNLSVDCMYGLPEQSRSDLQETIEWITNFKNIKHVSAYSLIVEKNTALAKNLKNKKYFLPEEEDERKAHYFMKSELTKRGFLQYEISNYAIPGYESKHNSGYWQLKPYYGVGLGAASFVDGVRLRTEANMQAYLKKGASPTRIPERRLTRMELMEDYVMLGLRMTEGIDTDRFAQRFSIGFEQVFGESVKPLIREGFLQLEENRLFLTTKGQDFENYVNLALMAIKER